MITIFFLLISGCSTTENNKNKLKNSISKVNIYDDKNIFYKKNDFYVTEDINKVKEFEEHNKTLQKREQLIENNLKQIKNLENCNVNIIGNIAVVSIKINCEMNDRNLINIKNEIKKNVKTFDKLIDHVSVNAAGEFFENAKEDIQIKEEKIENNNLMEQLEENIFPGM